MRRWIAILLLIAIAFLGYMFVEARRMPAMRIATLPLAGLAEGQRPIRIALLGDSHLSGPDSSSERLDRIVADVNAQHPDLVVLAGDYIGDRKLIGPVYSRAQSVAPFAKLRAPLGIVAVLGNHDYWDDAKAVTAALRGIGATVLAKQAVVRGPLSIGGIDDTLTGHAAPQRTLAAVRRLHGAPLLVSHSPDVFPDLLPGAPLLLAAHTHCGQIVLPLYGAISVPSRYGSRYLCGYYREYGNAMIVSGGLGTSVLPLRLLARPDWWLITLVPPPDKSGGS
ncbi:MAG: metallophosphoesterase [Alphaproteobacteria bacterium]|nr:metallophosphoesterase [Alphaproteobacteria bacterium]